MTRERLQELRAANLPRLKFTDILTFNQETPLTLTEQEALNTYLCQFVAPQKNDLGALICVGCRNKIRGGIEGALLGAGEGNTVMKWSIAHGECECEKCGWPARAYHRNVGGEQDPVIKSMTLTLQYHPDELT